MVMAQPARSVGRPRTSPVPDGYYDEDAVAARRAYMARYKAEHFDGLKAYYKAWRAANPDKHRQYTREWAARDRARRAHAAANPPPAPGEPEEPGGPGEPEEPPVPVPVPPPYVAPVFATG